MQLRKKITPTALQFEKAPRLCLAAGDERNEAVHEVVQEVHGTPELCLASHFEYGTRVGYRRILNMKAIEAMSGIDWVKLNPRGAEYITRFNRDVMYHHALHEFKSGPMC